MESKRINLRHCKFQVLRDVATRLNLEITEDEVRDSKEMNFDIWWFDEPGKCSRDHMKKLKANQKVRFICF